MKRTLSTVLACLVSVSSHSITPPPVVQLSIDRVQNTVRVSWEDNGLLERASSPGGPWTAVEGAVSPHTLAPEGVAGYFRVRQRFSVSVARAGTGQGTVTSVPAGIDCGADCTEAILSGTAVTLTATAAAGSMFTGWSGDCTGTGPCELAVNAPRSVTATFTLSPTQATGFVNGDFEQGPNVGWVQDPGNMIYTAAELQVTPHSGNYAAWVGYDTDNRRFAAIGQRVTLPSTPPIWLNFAIWLYSEELCDVPWYDTFGIYVDSEALEENPRLCRGNTGGDGWRRLSYDLSSLAGRTVAIAFGISSTDTLASVALIDDVSISAAPW